MRRSLMASVLMSALALVSVASPALAQAPDPEAVRKEIEQLRKEFEEIRRQYGARLAALEAKVAAAPAVTQEQPAAAAAAQAPVVADIQPQPAPVSGGASAGASKVFNPDIAAIGNFLGSVGRSPGNPNPGKALELHESEVSLQAIVDPYARADFFLSFGEQGVGVEEGFVTFPTIPGGCCSRWGRCGRRLAR